MLNRIQAFIERNDLLNSSVLHLVGLSGGADSVALLLILKELGYRIEAVHCNFRLRGEESDRDEQFVRSLCRQHDIPLHVIHFETREYAALHQVSIEMAARDLRYGYFRQLCQDIGAADICIAHHRNDAVETLLMNLLRGAGIHGLTGIRPKNDIVRRPLLCINRDEILQYLDSIGQPYVTDSSNLEADVLRNKIRLKVLPLLEEIAPGAAENIGKSALFLGEAEKMYNRGFESERQACLHSDSSLGIDELLQSSSPSSFLHEWLTPMGFNSTQTEQILSSLTETGREFHSATHILVIDRQQLIVERHAQPGKTLKIPEWGTYRYDDSKAFKFEMTDELSPSRTADVATVDADKVQFPLTLRPVQQGDRFVPFGMKGSKLVSDYLTDQKLNIFEKRRQLAVVDASGAIVWLVGRRTDNRFRVGDETTQVLRISITK